MKLNSVYKNCNSDFFKDEFYCDLTIELDHLAGLKRPEDEGGNSERCWNHYLLFDNLSKKDRHIGIRIPGGTVGSLRYDENNIITSITVSTDYIIKTYPENVNELINEKFVGVKLEF